MIEAKRSLRRGFVDGEVVYFSGREDIFGVFDLAIFPVSGYQGVDLVQVTTWPRPGQRDSAIQNRKRKVARWVEGLGGRPAWLDTVLVMAWESRRYFHRWKWNWESESWEELDPLPVPLPRAPRKAARSYPKSRAPGPENPFG